MCSTFPYQSCRWEDDMAARKKRPRVESGPALSGYRIVWLIVLFDLPVSA